MKETSKMKRIVAMMAAVLMLLPCLCAVTACNTGIDEVIPWMDGTEAVTEADTDNMVIYVSGTELGAETVEPEVPGSVVYTGDVHAGTNIYYVGSGENRDRIIVIDAGHQEKGNAEQEPVGPGATETQAKVSFGTTGTFTGGFEYELNLKVSLALRDELVKRGYSVVMIRETNQVNISNAERAKIANDYNAAAFIRVHANGWTDETRDGAMTVCSTPNNPYPDCAAVYNMSRLLADCVLNTYCKETGISRYRLWETDTKAGINWCAVPTIIIEMGFMTNRTDDEKMATDEFKVNAAKGIADGIDLYFDKLYQ